ncbi:MAG: PspC domain-containing protein [Acidimicrobiales bacterium]|nr:PspC domain-containing protein [Acidimicrobiales bacterium]
MLGGVCGGISRATGIDVTLVRIAFVLLVLGSGVGLFLYALGWLLLPLEGEDSTILGRSLGDRSGLRLIVALVPAILVLQIVATGLHVGPAGAVGWPLLLAFGAFLLIRRNASQHEREWINQELVPVLHRGGRGRRSTIVARVVLSVALAAVGLAILVLGHPSRPLLRPVIGSLFVMGALVVVFGPWWLSLLRDLLDERQARAMAEERARIAAHVHDSVLQTLALIQRSSDDPQQVVRLARAQERELRSWLFEGRPPGAIGDEAATLADAVALIQGQVEANHGISVQTVVVGDTELDDRLRELLEAAREATVNAAKWSGATEVSLFAEVEDTAVTVYVRDRGRGFDPSTVAPDRQGIAQSIRARMDRVGGQAVLRSAPGRGTEVELTVPRRVAAA